MEKMFIIMFLIISVANILLYSALNIDVNIIILNNISILVAYAYVKAIKDGDR